MKKRLTSFFENAIVSLFGGYTINILDKSVGFLLIILSFFSFIKEGDNKDEVK